MKRTNTIVIGGGQAGLAMSRCLGERGIDHVVLERGRIGERWRSERWDSLRLLTPSWQTRLPGWSYSGPDPDGFMAKDEFVGQLERYARSFEAPVESGVAVTRVERAGIMFRVTTDWGAWNAENVVIATGHCDTPFVPEFASGLPADIEQVAPTRYRNPRQLREGGVLIVGASSTGLQLADEIHRSGRPVTLAVGKHTRMPRRYRGRDILWWFDRLDLLREGIDDVANLEASRKQPSMQLVGRADHASLDLGALRASGVRLLGRAMAADGARMHFDGDLQARIDASDAKLARVLARIEAFIARTGMSRSLPAPEPIDPIYAPEPPVTLDLHAAGIRTVLWATGYRRSYPWLRFPVLDDRGEIRHAGGITPVPGLYVLGLHFLRRRNSSFIDGVGADARDLTSHLAARLRRHQIAA